MHTFPFFTSYDDMLAMLVCATRWLYTHLYTLAYMFMHESCLLVCRPCFNTIKLWTSDPNLHLSLTDTTFCLFSCLFAFSFVCLLSCYACHVYHAHLFYAFSYTLCIFSVHCLSDGFLSLPLHYIHEVRTHGAKARFPRNKQKGCRCVHVVKLSGYN